VAGTEYICRIITADRASGQDMKKNSARSNAIASLHDDDAVHQAMRFEAPIVQQQKRLRRFTLNTKASCHSG
jgi:hypothetical protein